MSFEGFNDKDEPICDINMTPLIDVMLVLLVIFIITAPLLTHGVKIDLPKEPAKQLQIAPNNINISINAQNEIFWNSQKISITDLNTKFITQSNINKDTTIELRADNKTAYEWVAKVMSGAQQAGLYKIGFVVDSNK